MAKSPVLITAPTVEPVTLTETRLHCDVLSHHQDQLIDRLVVVAREHLEQITWSALCTQTWDTYFDSFASMMFLPKPPVQSITSVTYTDGNGDSQTLASSVYELSDRDGVGFVQLKWQQTWPTIRGHTNDIVIRTVNGYGLTADVPTPIRQAALIAVRTMFEQPEEIVTGTIATLLPGLNLGNLISPYRFNEFKEKVV